MASVVITMKIMPEDPSTDLAKIEHEAKARIHKHTGSSECKVVIEPIAFGIKAIKITFIVDEDKGSPDELEADIGKISHVNSVETIDVRRALG